MTISRSRATLSATAAAPRKRPWDPVFLATLDQANKGDPVQFELVGGEMAVGVIRYYQSTNRSLIHVAGELTLPERGRFFFQKQTRKGHAGDYVGVAEFPASGRAYRIEPTGPGNSPELVERGLGEVLCLRLPPPDNGGTNHTANIPPLNPDNFPNLPIPGYQNGIIRLESLHGATAVVYLDFQAGYTPAWGGITYASFNMSNDQIRTIWSQVAKCFLPFEINITTDLRIYQSAPAGSRQHVIITPTDTAQPNVGGVAYVGSFNWTGDTPCWIFINVTPFCAEACAHEIGHTLGLNHEGRQTAGSLVEYYTGQGTGATSWAPIMGLPYFKSVIQWSKGEYLYASNPEDELAIISSHNNNLGYRADDTGATLETSRFLETYADNTAGAEGVIERTGDVDSFQFTTGSGTVSLRADPLNTPVSLVLQVMLCDANNTVLARSNPQDTLWAALSTNLPAGTYTFSVMGAGRNDPSTTGFSAYASLGYYSITGSVTNPRLPTRLSIVEHSPNGSFAGTVPANNPRNDPLAYAIVSGNSGNTFAINNAGVLTVADNRLLDYATLAGQSSLAAQFELLVDINNLSNPSLTESHRRVVVAVTPVLTAPLIVQQPQSLTVFEGTLAAFSVSAKGNEPLYPFDYQWFLNGVSLAGATTYELILPNAQTRDSGSYRVTVSNSLGVVTSAIATLSVLPTPPCFVTQPRSQAVFPGSSVNLVAWATGSEPLAYQWQLNGSDLPGQTNTVLTLTNVQSTDGGNYQIVVTNVTGRVASSNALLAIVAVAAWGWNAYGQTDVPFAATNLVQISAGARHNLALARDGRIVAWGAGEETNVPSGLSDIVAVAAGGTHSLALSTGGKVFAWGGNNAGQTNVPTGLSNAVAIAAGGNHSLALKSDGTVTAWGLNTLGQTTVPIGLTNVVAISAGSNHNVALTGQGTVVAWGDNRFGQLIVPPYLADVVAVAAGAQHCLALLRDGTVAAWGWNFDSQATVPAGLSNVVAIAAGAFHSLALRRDGTIVGWGAGSSYVWAYPNSGQAIISTNLVHIAAISAGTAHSLALAGGGAPFITQPPVSQTVYRGTRAMFRASASGALPMVYQWQLNGANLAGATDQLLLLEEAGQAGDYRVVVRNLFGVVTSPIARLTLVDQPPYVLVQPQSQIAFPGSEVTLRVLAVGSGPLRFQWYSGGAEIPGATNTALTLSQLLESQSGDYYVVVSNTVGTVTSAMAHIKVIQVVAWGAGTDYAGNPGFGQAVVPAGLRGVVRLAAGPFHSLALKSDGTVAAWGAGTNVSTDPHFGQSKVPAGLANVVAIAAGGYHSLALKADGTITAWGLADFGATTVPVGLNNVVAIAAGDFHSVALRGDGRVVVWGDDPSVNNVPDDATNVVAIASAGANIVGLRADGTLVRWGDARYVPAGGLFTGIAAGAGECLALQGSGRIVTWDYNDLPPGAPSATAVAAGFLHNLALKSNGTVFGWGFLVGSFGLDQIPLGLTNVIDIACGDYHNLAAVGSPGVVIQNAPPDRTAELGGDTLFSVQAGGVRPLSFRWQFNGTDLPGATTSRFKRSNLRATDAGDYRVIVSNPFGAATSRAARLVVLPSLAQALNATGLVWSAAGDCGWWVQTNITHDGVAAAQAAHVGDGQQSTIRTVVSGPGTLRFWWAVSSEQDYDFLVFNIDGTNRAVTSGGVNWQQMNFTVGAGAHTLIWGYLKDSAYSAGLDAAWLDEVTFTTNAPVITRQPASQTVSMGADVVLSVTASGAQPISYQWLRDGANLPGETLSTLTMRSANRRTSGSYTVAVRNTGGTTLSGTASVQVRVAEKLVSPAWSSGSGFTLLSRDVDGGALLPGDLTNFEAQASTNLAAWITLTNALSISNGFLLLADPQATNHAERFYRIRERVQGP